jgi:hypothetical protein
MGAPVLGQVLNENWVLLIEKWVGNIPRSYENSPHKALGYKSSKSILNETTY